MAPRSGQVSLDFDKLTEKSLQPIVKKFKLCGYTVTDIDAPNKGKRESGFLVKNFTLTFEDGQQLLVRVKAGGIIFQVKLNNKVIPVRNVDNLDKAIGEMADAMYFNAKAFARNKAQRERRKLKPPKPSVTTTRAEKIKAAKEDLAQLKGNIADLERDIDPRTENLADLQRQIADARSSLASEMARTSELERAIAAVEKGV